MGKKEENEYSSIVNSNNMLLSFEGWIKYIEGFSRGLQTTKTVDAMTVFDCIGEIMEYMKSLKNQLVTLLTHCEDVLEQEEICNTKISSLEKQITHLIDENKSLQTQNDQLFQENNQLKEATILLHYAFSPPLYYK